MCICEIQSVSGTFSLYPGDSQIIWEMAVSGISYNIISLWMNQQGLIEVVMESHLINLVSRISQIFLSLHINWLSVGLI